MRATRETGAYGEFLARQFLIDQGYNILESNWSTRHGEIDIIAKSGGWLVFVEVKTRHSQDTESAFAGITATKHERLVKAVYQYLHEREMDEDVSWRIDVIGVALDKTNPPVIDHIEDAFDW